MIKHKKIKHDIQKLLPKLKDIFKNQEGLIAAYLFGSQAKGHSHPLSDVDIAYLLEKNLSPSRKEAIEKTLYKSLSMCLKTDEISFVNLSEAPPSIKYAAISARNLLYCSDDSERIDFEQKALINYFDTKPIRDEYFYYLSKKIKEGEFGNRYK
ncbi:MAG: nucleotidyltransferase domain-containing protein [Candidatus Aminicenantes bacterium]|nr:nucleotidyltransferase domain-containing protein [Candidatus Aminicenantes bacterium]